MRVIIFSDAHVPTRAPRLPSEFLTECKRADWAIFLGDAVRKAVLREVSELVDLTYVVGNMDEFEGPEIAEVSLQGRKVGLLHGHQFSRGDYPAISSFARERGWEMVLTGHTHSFHWDGFVLNPGSVTGAFSAMADGEPSYLVVEDDVILRITKKGEEEVGVLPPLP